MLTPEAGVMPQLLKLLNETGGILLRLHLSVASDIFAEAAQ
jgi:hypothetical protein